MPFQGQYPAPSHGAGRAAARPVIVLEHGAWADASSWSQVIAILQREGFTVYAPPDPLRGLSLDSTYLHDFLTQNAALAGDPRAVAGVITRAARAAGGSVR